MIRHLGCLLAILIVATSIGRSGPVEGSWSKHVLIPAHGREEFTEKFVAGKRACVIAVGDHNPPAPMGIIVYDESGQKVAEDPGAVDYVAVTWYPARTANYKIEIKSTGNIENKVYVSVK